MVVVANLLCTGAVDRSLGMLATTMQRLDEAQLYFESALQLEESMEALPSVARTRYWFARMTAARNGEGHRSRAAELLQRAADTADALSMPKLAADCQTLL